MPAKDLVFHQAAREAILRGVHALADAVAVTLGPAGRTVAIERSFGAPMVTKDGASVAKEIELEGRLENLGAQLVREVAARTSDEAGDGTTTATLLARALVDEGLKLVAAGHDPMALKRGIDRAVAAVVARLRALATPTHGRAGIAQVGAISANGDAAIGEIIADAMEKVGAEGVITVEEAKGLETTLEVVEGMRFDRGYLSASFVTDLERMEVVLEEPYLLLVDRKLSAMADLVPILEAVAGAGKPLLVVAEEVEGEALAALVVNKLQGALPACAVKAPGYGDRRKELLGDLAVLTGGAVVSEELGLTVEQVGLAQLGRARRVLVDRDATTVVGGAGAKADVEARARQLRAQIAEATSDYDREKLQERLAHLAGGVAVIRIGAPTELELKERKARADDAVHATRAAVEEGVVPGGGVAYLRALGALDAVRAAAPPEEVAGIDVVRRALELPARRIAENAGWDGAIVLERIRSAGGAQGFNAAAGRFEDLAAAGILDPAKVSRAALENAASVAGLLLTTEVAIAERPRAPEPAPGGGMGDDDGDY